MKKLLIALFLLCLFGFSTYLMGNTFQYDSDKSEIHIASRLWSDFGAHIPLIRSFTYGNNWPPEYPLYPGEKIRYHFLFYAAVGVLEKIGIRIDYALNSLSVLGFFGMLMGIYLVAIHLFKRRIVAILSTIFFLFNGSFSFFNFFQNYPWSSPISSFKAFLSIMNFPSFGPWDKNLVTAFTHLNVYTNQRHLAPSFAIVLFIFLSLLKLADLRIKKSETRSRLKRLIIFLLPTPNKKRQVVIGIFIGIFTGILFFLNQSTLLPLGLICIYFFLCKPTTRWSLSIAAICSLPFVFLFTKTNIPAGIPTYELGYLVQKPLTLQSFSIFWLHNLGLHILLIPIGFLFAPKKIRLLFIPLLILFALPNIYRFSTDMINNHKFFNFFMIIGGMYSAYVLAIIHDKFYRLWPINSLFVSICCLFLTLSGIIDFMVIKNDYYLVLNDIPKNKDATAILQTTSPNAIILNSTWFYHPASLAGRKIFNGYSFFTWSAGYDAYGRERIVKDIYQAEQLETICRLTMEHNISYVELNDHPEDFLKPISSIWQHLPFFYQNKESGVTIYKSIDMCAHQ